MHWLQETSDRVTEAAIWAPNCAEWIVAALAIQYVGGTLVTVNTRYKAGEARDIIADSGSSVAFVVDEFLGSKLCSRT